MYYPSSENKGADQLICVFVFAYAKFRFSHDAAQTADDNTTVIVLCWTLSMCVKSGMIFSLKIQYAVVLFTSSRNKSDVRHF